MQTGFFLFKKNPTTFKYFHVASFCHLPFTVSITDTNNVKRGRFFCTCDLYLSVIRRLLSRGDHNADNKSCAFSPLFHYNDSCVVKLLQQQQQRRRQRRTIPSLPVSVPLYNGPALKSVDQIQHHTRHILANQRSEGVALAVVREGFNQSEQPVVGQRAHVNDRWVFEWLSIHMQLILFKEPRRG